MAVIGFNSVYGTTQNAAEGWTIGYAFDVGGSGWLTDIQLYARSEGGISTSTMKLIIYDSERNRLTQSGNITCASSWLWRTYTLSNPIKLVPGTNTGALKIGFHVNQTSAMPLDYRWDGTTAWNRRYQETNSDSPANPLNGTFDGSASRVSIYSNYTPNATPSVGAPSAPASGATGVSLTPTFTGTIPHPSSENGLDSTSAVHLQIKNVATQELVYDSTFTPNAQGTFSKVSPVTLAADTSYTWKYRHADSFGVYSGFSAERTFTTLSGPGTPTPVAPSGKINAISGYNYTYIYDHPTPLNANAVQILVKNATGTTTIYDSGTVVISPTIASGTQRDTLEFHANLAWGTSYTHQARFRDTNNTWGPYSSLMSFQTDAAPSAPTNLQPSANVASSNTLMTCNVSDPDGDAITAAEIEIVNASTNAVLSGFPKAMTVDSNAGTASYQASGDLTLGTAYKWRARANDGLGPGYGAYSGYAFFTYAAGPTIALLSPMSTRTNIVKQPSAEGDPALVSAYWTETARTGTDFVDRVTDLDPAYGSAAWEGTASATGDNRFRTDYETVDATKPYFFQSHLKRYSGTAATHFAIECYNSSNVLQGTVYPTTIATANGTNVAGSWTRYGGIVWHIGSGNSPAFPATTAKVRVQITHSRNSIAEVRSDAVFAEQLAIPTTTTPANWLTLQPWHGYGDPDLGGYATGGYAWTLDESDSASQNLSVLTSPAQNVLISYTSGVTKHSDRLYIQRWTGSVWASKYDSGWVSTTRTLIPVPSNVFTSEERYRIRVEARDTNLVVGSSPWVEVDVRFDGPPEPEILTQAVDPVGGTVGFAYTLTNTPTEPEFGGVEFAREAIDGSEPLTIIDVNTAISDGAFTDHFPRSGVLYRYKMRQVKLEGFSRVQGRWAIAEQVVDYSPFAIIKDAESPEILSQFETRIENVTAPEEDTPISSMLGWGQTTYSHDVGIARLRAGEIAAEFFSEAGVYGVPDHVTRYEILRKMITGVLSPGQRPSRRTICILLRNPDAERIFAVPVGPVQREFEPPVGNTKRLRFSYQETSWVEDWYVRNGWT